MYMGLSVCRLLSEFYNADSPEKKLPPRPYHVVKKFGATVSTPYRRVADRQRQRRIYYSEDAHQLR